MYEAVLRIVGANFGISALSHLEATMIMMKFDRVAA